METHHVIVDLVAFSTRSSRLPRCKYWCQQTKLVGVNYQLQAMLSTMDEIADLIRTLDMSNETANATVENLYVTTLIITQVL
jgi:hypothetical protein